MYSEFRSDLSLFRFAQKPRELRGGGDNATISTFPFPTRPSVDPMPRCGAALKRELP
jgi:hypothetical protein